MTQQMKQRLRRMMISFASGLSVGSVGSSLRPSYGIALYVMIGLAILTTIFMMLNVSLIDDGSDARDDPPDTP